MSRRLLWLHARARGAPAVLAGLCAVAVGTWWAGNWMMDRPYFSDQQARIPVAVLAPLLVAGLLLRTLGAPDELLERSTPTPWPYWRAVHLSCATALSAAALGIAGLRRPELFGACSLARGCAGYFALMAIAAAVIGVRAAWLPVLAWAGATYLAAPQSPAGVNGLWAWPMQPWSADLWPQGSASLAVAGSWLLALAIHRRFGAATSTDQD